MKSLHNLIAKKIRPIELAWLLKKILFIRRNEEQVDNFSWYIDPISDFGYRMLNEKTYEPAMTSVILSNLREGDSFVDLGANEGYFSILASRAVGKTGKVFCFEPQQRLWHVILRNIALNKVDNIHLLPYGVSDESKSMKIVLSPSINTGSTTILADGRRRFWRRQNINVETLDNIFFPLGINLDLVKIDIEGYEFFALKGAIKLLESRRIKKIVIEMHDKQLESNGQSPGMIHKFLEDFDFQFRDGLYSMA